MDFAYKLVAGGFAMTALILLLRDANATNEVLTGAAGAYRTTFRTFLDR